MQTEDFLVEDYKLKLDYLKSQFDRLWTRFNFFLSVEVALFGFLGWLVFDQSNLNATPLLALLGLLVSVVWYVIGAQDRALVGFYRKNVSEAAKRIADSKDELKWYADKHVAVEVPNVSGGFTSWYRRRTSITRMPVFVALIFSVVWLAIFLCGRLVFRMLK